MVPAAINPPADKHSIDPPRDTSGHAAAINVCKSFLSRFVHAPVSTAMPNRQVQTLIVGAGLAGLTAANVLHRAGHDFHVIEAADAVGGRVRTDRLASNRSDADHSPSEFRLDRGFQVLLTAYPTAQKYLDYPALDLRRFEPGAWIRCGGNWKLLGDPWRRPATAMSTITNPAGSLADKIRIGLLRRHVCRGTLADIYEKPNEPTIDFLKQFGFSSKIIDGFFRPFLGGVFLDPSLQTSRRMFEFVFRMFSTGDVAVPAGGMQAIPEQLASRFDANKLSLQSSAVAINDGIVTLASGETIQAEHILLAIPPSAAAKCIESIRPQTLACETTPLQWKQTFNVYFAARRDAGIIDRLAKSKTLLLGGDQSGEKSTGDPTAGDPSGNVIQTATVISGLSDELVGGDRSRHLISVTLRVDGDQDVMRWDVEKRAHQAARQLATWMSCQVDDLTFLRCYPIRYGLPAVDFSPVQQSVGPIATTGTAEIFVAGDHLSTPSIEGAMSSGQRAAEMILSKNKTAPS